MNQLKAFLIVLITLWCIFGLAKAKRAKDFDDDISDLFKALKEVESMEERLDRAKEEKPKKKPTLVCRSDGYYRDPNECAKFYRCASGQSYPFRCPEKTQFSITTLVCDWAYNVKCVDK